MINKIPLIFNVRKCNEINTGISVNLYFSVIWLRTAVSEAGYLFAVHIFDPIVLDLHGSGFENSPKNFFFTFRFTKWYIQSPHHLLANFSCGWNLKLLKNLCNYIKGKEVCTVVSHFLVLGFEFCLSSPVHSCTLRRQQGMMDQMGSPWQSTSPRLSSGFLLT